METLAREYLKKYSNIPDSSDTDTSDTETSHSISDDVNNTTQIYYSRNQPATENSQISAVCESMQYVAQPRLSKTIEVSK